jgi:hypothetical protein
MIGDRGPRADGPILTALSQCGILLAQVQKDDDET